MDIPLYMQAKNNTLGSLELMDAETLDWIEQTSMSEDLQLSKGHTFRLSGTDIELLYANATQAAWFSGADHITSIHGIGHGLRVMVSSLVLCRSLQIKKPLPYIVAASIHDVRRVNDNADPMHGDRAAVWFRKNHALLPFDNGLVPEDRKMIMASVRYHSADYSDMPDLVMKRYGVSIDILKAADALDRFRMPKEKWWPRHELIRLTVAHSLIPLARELTLRSERKILDGADPYQAVFGVARDLFTRE